MGNSDLEAILKKKMSEAEKKIAERVAPRINNLFEESVANAMVDYYDSYDPESYKRTGNFMNAYKSARTSGKGNILTMSVDSGYMDNYPGFSGFGYGNTYTTAKIKSKNKDEEPSDEKESKEKAPTKKLNASIAFDFFFKNGEHGHDSWLMTKSIAPQELITRDVDDKFGGRAEKIIQEEFNKIK